jgi:DNA-binding MarR family transcriptional regulator
MSRLCDRLAAKDLIVRATAPESRREVVVGLSPKGRDLVHSVTKRRLTEINRIARRIPTSRQRELVVALEAFAEAAGEVPDDAWKLGWS